MHMPIGVHCVLCIWCVLGIFVLSCSSPVQCITYGTYYIEIHRFRSCPFLVHCSLFLALWVVVRCWCSWRIFPHLSVWMSWWYFLFLGCSMWRLSLFCFCFFIGLFLDGFFFFNCIWWFSFCRRFCGKLLFCAISCINVHSFVFSLVLMGENVFW